LDAQVGGVTTQIPAPASATGRQPWWAEIPESRRRPIRWWLWSVAAMTFAVLVVGGTTRLTLSGLSIVEWRPFTGIIPPLTHEQWVETFEMYRQYPEYQTWRQGMSLAEFKFIFFWEYLHRLLARMIGVVFAVPLIVFAVRGWVTGPLFRRALLLFALGGAQGVLGWLMVSSGLVDRPSVSHYRLAAHLSLAFLIFGYAVWLARELARPMGVVLEQTQRELLGRLLLLTGAVLSVQIVWGALVAGLKAGRYYPTFPLMGGSLVPQDLLRLDPAVHNFIANPVAVQWLHRLIGTVLLAVVLAVFVTVRRRVQDSTSRRYADALTGLTVVQYGLGVATLVLMVPVSLGVIHQGMAMVLFGVWLCWLHHVLRSRETSTGT
jgi:heme a synthase